MLTNQSMLQTAAKLDRFCQTLRGRLFVPQCEVPLTAFSQSATPHHAIPEGEYGPDIPDAWGGEGVYAWFRMHFTVPDALAGRSLYLWPRMGYYEGTLWVDGCIHSNYASKIIMHSHGNHYCNRFAESAEAGRAYTFDVECYAWHDMPGTSPLSNESVPHVYKTGGAAVCTRDELVARTLFALETLLSLRKALPETSFRRAEVENALYDIHLKLMYDPDSCSEAAFRAGMEAVQPILAGQLAKRNGDATPYVGLIGHSHMDTAWLWPIVETKKKCARTYANQLNLMAEYPEYRFIQSSAYHADILRRHYPELFARVQQAVKAGKWEPNGGVWVECDCNVTGGEYLLRQFVWGQRFTRKYYGYTSDTFWLPDTFGYSAAIPQIMQGCGVKYFVTTKMSWNDTTRFPYTTFRWQGLDGSRVLSHFTRIDSGPAPETLTELTTGGDAIREKRVSPLRLFSFGKGDGGGGPEFEMLERARHLTDLCGIPRSGYTTVSDFMHRLEESLVNPSMWAGELYLEKHRATLTNQHEIKRNNRKCEQALHTLEAAAVMRAVQAGEIASGEKIDPLTNTLLVNQFHDILPGTCIHRAHHEARKAVGGAIRQAGDMLKETLRGNVPVLLNAMSFAYEDVAYLPGAWQGVNGCAAQVFTDMDGQEITAARVTLAPYSATQLQRGAAGERACPFTVAGDQITTPHALVTLDDNGGIRSLIDRKTGRELVGGLPFNTLLMTEDVPTSYDNWDIDADEEDKFAPAGALISREVVSMGAVELRIRQTIRLTEKTVLTQDLVFDAETPRIAFDTVADWQEDHRFLKAAFDTALRPDGVRSEIQFGHIRRGNHRDTDADKARFEVCNHKYSDLSEYGCGIALLNDCKYGLSVREGSMRLSLHKGGNRPDRLGDKGVHRFRYALLPHEGAFGVENVVRPAYCFNYQPEYLAEGCALPSLVSADAQNVVIETIKPCEDASRAYILRLYECAGGYARAKLAFSHPVKALAMCTMLEEEVESIDPAAPIVFEPFKIITLRVEY